MATVSATDGTIDFNEREILTNAGKIVQEIAEKLAATEYEQYNQRNSVISPHFIGFTSLDSFLL